MKQQLELETPHLVKLTVSNYLMFSKTDSFSALDKLERKIGIFWESTTLNISSLNSSTVSYDSPKNSSTFLIKFFDWEKEF